MKNKREEKKNEKKFVNPDAPNWLCCDCNYEKQIVFFDKAPLKCPRCGSKNVVDLRKQKLD
ncbi:hypothetical protein HZB94_00915 [Candidatus Falkowbacteria bacterium]|nr:hypothetical protein [Candidatus Falkowbacteria bacterium]